MNKKAVLIGGAVVSGLLVLIVANVSKPPPGTEPPTKEEQEKNKPVYSPATAKARNVTEGISDQPVLPMPIPSDVPMLPGTAPTPTKPGPVAGVPTDGSVPTLAGPSAPAPAMMGQSPEMAQAAMGADTGLASFAALAAAPAAPAPAPAAPSPAQNELAFNRGDPNAQGEKEAFLQQARTTRAPTAEIVSLEPPITEFEIKTGSVIPSTLVSHIISDLPGEIVGQVSQNVFDSTTGRYLLIPQGTRLFGKYSSAVTFGQDRLLVVWNRLIFPNGTTMDLTGMQGYDKEGKAGNADLVNNHYLRTFGFGLLTTMFSAAFQLSQPQQPAGPNGTLSNQQVVGAAISQQIAQFGLEIARRNLQVQPTIEIRKGYTFLVLVNKDLVFAGPYRP
jgi:type IV secretion system protein VirB10